MNDLQQIIYNKFLIKKTKEEELTTHSTKGILYIVATPIGNLNDITLRAIEILNNTDIIICEDTRHSYKILKNFIKNKKIISYHKFNERARLNQIINYLKSGEDVALISDAGTPAIADPGIILIQEAIKENIMIEIIPGPSAVISALVLSGFNPIPFMFAGYLPNKSKQRLTILTKYKNFLGTIIFFEAPHRILSSLKDINKIFKNTQLCIARELTKIHQEIIRGTPSHLLEILSTKKIKGELTILIDNNINTNNIVKLSKKDLKKEFNKLVENGLNKKDALQILSELTGLSKKIIYSAIYLTKK